MSRRPLRQTILGSGLGLLLLLALSTSALAQARVLPAEIKDSRTTGSFAGLEIELKVIGDAVADAKALRAIPAAATDDTGRNLLDGEDRGGAEEFRELSRSDRNAVTVTLKLRNPARQAMTLKEVSGVVELFVPQRDPASVVVIADIKKTAGAPFAAPALAAAGLEITMWTKAQVDARKKAERERLKARMEKTRNDPSAIGETMGRMVGEMFSFGGSEGSLSFQIKGPTKKIVGIEFLDAKGAVLSSGGRMTVGGGTEQTRTYDLGDKLAQAARVRIYVATEASLVRAPFTLVGVPLP
ncbi:MAG: hypothetical protein FJZ38_07820 [Candidatus Rokubacteria bacterium]|nr:hypothetical protein [Candidatus Rokubacteria bacterium]